MGLVVLWHVGSSRTRDRTRVPCIGRWIFNHCATREVPISFHDNIELENTESYYLHVSVLFRIHFFKGKFYLVKYNTIIDFYFDPDIVGNIMILDNMEWTLWGYNCLLFKSCTEYVSVYSYKI